eukprot:scaffold1596_cov302-Pinguiococcus_pyrenoidosus.AAC.28
MRSVLGRSDSSNALRSAALKRPLLSTQPPLTTSPASAVHPRPSCARSTRGVAGEMRRSFGPRIATLGRPWSWTRNSALDVAEPPTKLTASTSTKYVSLACSSWVSKVTRVALVADAVASASRNFVAGVEVNDAKSQVTDASGRPPVLKLWEISMTAVASHWLTTSSYSSTKPGGEGSDGGANTTSPTTFLEEAPSIRLCLCTSTSTPAPPALCSRPDLTEMRSPGTSVVGK